MVKKQKLAIIILAATFAVLTLIYFLVISPLVDKRAQTDDEEPPTLLDGEALDTDNSTILIFPYAKSDEISNIEVHNQYTSFKCYRNSKDNEFYLEGYEQAPFSADTLSSLVVAAGYTSTLQRVTEECTNWENYGLDDESSPAWYSVTLLNGTTHKLYIGNLIPSGGGYYCKYDGRNALYVIPSSISSSLLVPVENLVTPYLGYVLDSSSYSCTDQTVILKNGESFVYITYDKDKANSSETVKSVYNMIYPAKYTVNDTNFSEVLLSFCQLKGYATIKVGTVDKPLHEDEELMAQYGFEDMSRPPYELYYSYNDIDSIVLFAPSGVDGYYFAYSYLFNLIALIETDTVPYLEWDIKNYISTQIFQESINDVSKIEISGKINEKEINETFTLVGEGSDIVITPSRTEKPFSTDLVRNFRQFYIVLLQLDIKGYMKTEGVEDYTSHDEIACFRVTMDDGEVYEYKYYAYSSRRCYVTINGEGEFYVNTKDVYKVLTDANRAANGKTVDRTLDYSDYVD